MPEAAVLTPPQVGDIWHRFDDHRVSFVIDAEAEHYGTRTELFHTQFEVTKVTPKGVWLSGVVFGVPRFVLLAARKQYASPTQELALLAFLARKARQESILLNQLSACQAMQERARAKLSKLHSDAETTADL